MIRQNQSRRVNMTAIQPALKSIDRTANRLLRSNEECLILYLRLNWPAMIG